MAIAGMKLPWFHLLILMSLLAVCRSEVQGIQAPQCVYSFYVKTGSLPAAGTDSRIGVTFFDSAKNWIRVDNIESWGKMGKNYNYFEQGQLDIFSGYGPCLPGPVCSLRVTSNGFGILASWNVEYLDVTVTGYGKDCVTQRFSLNTWLIPPFLLTVNKDNCLRASATAEHDDSGFASQLASVVGHVIN